MVSFGKFALCLIMCCFTGSTSRSILDRLKPKKFAKKTKKDSGDTGASSAAASDSPSSGASSESPGATIGMGSVPIDPSPINLPEVAPRHRPPGGMVHS